MYEPVHGIKHKRQRASMVRHLEGAAGNAFLDNTLQCALHLIAVFAGHTAPLNHAVGKQIKNQRIRLKFIAIGAVKHRKHPLQLVIGGVWRLGRHAQAQFQRLEPAGGNFVQKGNLGGKITVNIGMGHAQFFSHPDNGHAPDAIKPDMRRRKLKNTLIHRFGIGTGHVSTSPVVLLDPCESARPCASARYSPERISIRRETVRSNSKASRPLAA